MRDLSKIHAMVVDTGGLNCELALLLAKSFGKVYYFTPNDEAYTTHNRSVIGKGYPEIELCDNIDFKEDEITHYIFSDVGQGPAAWHKRFEDGKKVWSSFYGEELEMDRVKTKELFKSLGIAVGPYEVVEGSDDLLKYLKSFKNGYVKTSWFRGEFESRRWKDWTNSHKWIERIIWQLGSEAKDYTFIVEDALPKDPSKAGDWVELGEDKHFVKAFPSKYTCGIEKKDAGYAGCFKDASEFPSELTDVSNKLVAAMNKVGYQGYFSTEVRIGPELIAYPIDLTCRPPSPPNEALMGFYKNTAEIIAAGCEGELVDPEPQAKYVMQVVIKSEGHSPDAEQTITFPEEFRDNVKLHCARKTERSGEYEIVPQNFDLSEVGAVTGWGDTLKDAHDMVKEIASHVDGTYISMDVEDVLKEVELELEKADQLGVGIS